MVLSRKINRRYKNIRNRNSVTKKKRYNNSKKNIKNKRNKRNKKSKKSKKSRKNKTKKYINLRGGSADDELENTSELKKKQEAQKIKTVNDEKLLEELTEEISEIVNDNSEKIEKKIETISSLFIKASENESDKDRKSQLQKIGRSFNNLDPKCMDEEEIKKKIRDAMVDVNSGHSDKDTSKTMNIGIGFGLGSLVTFLLAEGIPLLYKHFKK